MRSLLLILSMLGAVSVQANLLVNGDFESGNTGFTSDYIFESPALGENRYFIASENPWAGTFGSLADHTSGSGSYMVVNAAANTFYNFWIQNVDVVEGVEYTFSGYIANITFAPLPTIQLLINGDTFSGNSTYTLENASVAWNQFSFTWTSGFTGTIPLSLHETTGVAGGNDFAIDDLQMVPEPATIGLVALFGGGVILVRRIFQM